MKIIFLNNVSIANSMFLFLTEKCATYYNVIGADVLYYAKKTKFLVDNRYYPNIITTFAYLILSINFNKKFVSWLTLLVTIVSLAVHVSMSAPQELSLRAKSIQLTLMYVPSVAHALMYVLLRLSVFPLN